MKTIIHILVLLFALNTFSAAQNCVYYEYKISSEKESDGVSGSMKCFNQNGSSRVETGNLPRFRML